jgi:crotonobetainyl-CoA:carnitine CoA-transferase CaiB-like acyl-CoA transferase
VLTGVYATSAILAALHQRSQTGRGQRIDMALMDVAVAGMANQALNYLATGSAPKRLGNAHPSIAPYQVFACADGWIIIAVGNDGQFARLCALLDCTGLADDPHFATNPARVDNRAALDAALAPRDRAAGTRDALLAACEGRACPPGRSTIWARR